MRWPSPELLALIAAGLSCAGIDVVLLFFAETSPLSRTLLALLVVLIGSAAWLAGRYLQAGEKRGDDPGHDDRPGPRLGPG